MKEKRAYLAELETRLNEARGQIQQLQAKTLKAGGEARVQDGKDIDELHSQMRLTEEKIKALKDSREEGWEDLREDVENAWKAFRNTLSMVQYMDEKSTYMKELEARLNEGQELIERLEAKADTAEPAVRIKYTEEIEALRSKMKLAEQRINEIRHSREEAWGELKKGVDHAWKDLKNGFTKALSKF